MTWGTKESESKQPPVAYTAPVGGFVPVTSNNTYSHHPKKSVLAVSSLILISGIFCLLLGIAREAVVRNWHGLGIFCGVFFIITGIIGLVSVYRRTKARLIATAVLALLACLAAVWLGTYLSDWYWQGGYDDSGDYNKRKIDDGGVMPGDRNSTWQNDGKPRRTRMIHPSTTLKPSGSDQKDRKDDDDRHRDGDKAKPEGRDENERRYPYRKDKVLCINAVMFVFALLAFCCSVSLTVLALKTVTSPRTQHGMYPILTPVIAFPPSKNPNQLDSFNGNDYI